MVTSEDCLFCRIASKSLPSLVIYEDEKTFGFLDIMPRAGGHTLVVPKYHVATLAELPESEVPHLFLAVRKVAIVLKKALKADGLTIGINQGRISGQVVDHLHVHIMPRFMKDGGDSIQSVVNKPPEMSLQSLQKKILKNKN